MMNNVGMPVKKKIPRAKPFNVPFSWCGQFQFQIKVKVLHPFHPICLDKKTFFAKNGDQCEKKVLRSGKLHESYLKNFQPHLIDEKVHSTIDY